MGCQSTPQPTLPTPLFSSTQAKACSVYCPPNHRPSCTIVIDGTPYPWYEGQSFVFDDTYRHEVWNMTDQPRIVLLMHFRRPVRFPGSLVANGFLRARQASPFVQDGVRNQKRWQELVDRAEGR